MVIDFMDKILFLTMLYDFYGEFLTEKQKNIFELYHLNDFSLNEISSEYKISRQAVLDSIKRTEKSLIEYENKLFLIEKYNKRKKYIEEITNKIESLNSQSVINNSFINELKKDLSLLLD